MPESIHIPTIPGESSYIDPFDVAERDAILSAFENHPTHSFYYPYVRFLSLTACRPGEAICLTWGDITKGVTQVRFSRSYDSQLNVSKDTKTHKDRLFPINSTLKELLLDVRPAGASDDKLVFPAKKGGIINHNKFVSQVWKGCEHREKRDYDKKRTGSRVREYKGVLPALIKVGKVERYRPVYNLRHTGITLMVEALIPVNQVAKWVGNSSAVIEQYYLGNIHQFDSPLK
jgi:integrase